MQPWVFPSPLLSLLSLLFSSSFLSLSLCCHAQEVAAGDEPTNSPINATYRIDDVSCGSMEEEDYVHFLHPQVSGGVCFARASSVVSVAPVACSSSAATPPPLPSSWLQLANLPSNASSLCENFHLIEGSVTITCQWN